MTLYLLSLPAAGLFSVCDLGEEEAATIRVRLDEAGAFEGGAEAVTFEPVQPDDAATVDGLIDLWEAARTG